ncbi:hypothetical protein [Streptomyces sp. MBT62]|uniref:hypothetical protein n=1 Tax=Streptomyces sp. MBT62 TaxID=2800410 RepID=UPI00190B796A|nr:hypothetical protein [Streptomyces sp. MBT62]MBK3564735.1 hypothetical protein [Streptomyces sp. MBT62]
MTPRERELNPEILAEIARHPGTILAGSIYAVVEAQRLAAARQLARAGLWIHADVITDDRGHRGVDLSLVHTLAEQRVGPLDVHVIAPEPELGGLIEEISAWQVDRVTFPFESCPDPAAVADTVERIRASGAAAWLAVAPATELAAVRPYFELLDGLLVMLIEPGSTGTADLTLTAKAGQTPPALPAGVDGGVDADNLAACLRAGADYVVSGRALLSAGDLAS